MDQQSVDEIVLQFLQTTVLNLGTISIQNLTGHFSQLPADIRKKFNSTKAEVKNFLLAYPDIFIVNDEIVSISQKKDPLNLVDTSIQCEIPTMANNENDSNDDEVAEKRQNLTNCKGKLFRIFDVYGFIEYSVPGISASIYFDVLCFEDGRYENLSKLNVGDEINFCAKYSVGHKAPYRATKVWRTGYSISLQGSDRCYSSNTSLASQDSYQSEVLNGTGKVMKLTTNYGFIKPTGNTQGNVFFFRTKVQLPNVEEVKNLEDVLNVGDIFYFSAVQSRKKNADAPWEAVKVSRTPLENAWNGLSKLGYKSAIIRTGSTSSTDCSYYSSGLDIDGVNDDTHIYNQVGTIHQLAGSEPVIHFGKNETAVVSNNVVYKNNKLIEEFGWEIDEGTKVQFNAEYDDTNWRAVLIWIGDKPQLSNKKSCRKKNTQVKESTVSDLCEISLYDDQSDDGIWHKSSPHVDTTSTWDDENSENWPALKPPVSTKGRPVEKINLSKSEMNPKAFKSERINTISNGYEEKHGIEANTFNHATALSGDCQEVISVSNLKKNRKKKNILNANTSYATVVTSVSTDCQQSKNDSSNDGERLQRYKMNNGWEEESFNTNSEKWPSLSESPAASSSSTSKSNFHRSQEKLDECINGNKPATQQQIANFLSYSDFVSHKNVMQENYYSDSDKLDIQEIAPDILYNKDSDVTNSQSFDKVSAIKEVIYDKFADVMGTIVNIQKYSAFIKSDELHENLFFCWEQGFCDGHLVSKYYKDLGKAFNEFDHINFTYCRMIDESGKEWTSVLQVWKGKKPLQTTAECVEPISSENCCFKRNEICVHTSVTGKSCKEATVNPLKKIEIGTNFPEIPLITSHAAVNKNNAEDSGVCMEELEAREYEGVKTTNDLASCNLSSALNTLASCSKESKVKTEMKSCNQSTVNYASVSHLKTIDNPSQVEKNMKNAATNNVLNRILGLAHSLKPECLSPKESLPHTLSDDTRVSVRSQETQTDVTTCDEGIQTFITGTVLSIEIFPH